MASTREGAFVIIAEFEVEPGSIDAFLQAAIADASASVANEPGCRQFDVSRPEDQPNRVVLYEVYDSLAAFEAHLAMPHLKAFRDRIEPLVAGRQVRRLTRVHG